MIELSKNKALFRKALKPIYPEYYFREISFDEIKNLNPSTIPYPVILKPAVGFLSFGVYPIKNKTEWENTVNKLKSDIEKFKDIFPKSVVNTSSFIIEEMIEGDEFALDAYFNGKCEAVILNIYHHPFFDDKDVSDRLYYTSAEIIKNYHDKFQSLLNKIAGCIDYQNFPFHLELRANKDKIIPIELNPMRFCGWCITDMAQYCWGFNIYEYFLNQKKPNWENILKNSDDSLYYFTIGDIPQTIEKSKIKGIDFEGYLKNISNPLEVRKIDYKNNPVFAISFAKTKDINEIKNILKLNMSDFIKM